MDTDEADLVARVGGGDRRAMRALYETYQQAVFAFAYARCGQADRASDCVHDTMLAVWRTAARFSGRSSVKTWLFAIARKKLAYILRKRGRLTFVEEVEDGPDTAPNPEAAAIAASDSARLDRCLDGVSDRHRTAIRLAFLEDLSYPEIPEIESVPVGTIKTRIHHAKRALMRCPGSAARPSFRAPARNPPTRRARAGHPAHAVGFPRPRTAAA